MATVEGRNVGWDKTWRYGLLILGAAIGEALRLEDRLESLGPAVRRRFDRGGDEYDGRFVEGFVAASLVFCIGPLTISEALAELRLTSTIIGMPV